MEPFVRKIVVSVLLAMLVVAQAQSPHRLQLLEPGVFHGQDVRLPQPTSWVGIYCKEKGCTAQPTTVQSSRVADPLGDDDPDTPTGTLIRAATPDQPLFLVRGIVVTPRRIPTFFVGEQSIVAGDRFDAAQFGAGYTLSVEGTKTDQDQLPQGSRLILSNGTIKQELFSLPKGGNDPYITVLWIGDLDGDGKPDFYLNTSWHYNVSHKVLWLSSLARDGQIVGQGAFFETSGC